MLKLRRHIKFGQHGSTLIEVLVTIVILAFGLLGLATLQSKVQLASVESYQRAQAIILLSDMTQRISGRQDMNVAAYLPGVELGKEAPLADWPVDCSTKAASLNPMNAGPDRDLCDWNNALKGAAETKGVGVNAVNVGGMIDARGCITQLTAPVVATCTPGAYLVTIAWQGLHELKEPPAALICGKDKYAAGKDGYRRVVSVRIPIGLTGCL